ncbi:NADH:ubiquinone reductase (Na(+)-transporting) subunit F [Rhizobium aegyptiacum]|uniref:NADH:ubiquinone reductase (Na(+)-transporting) subunit F n=1 Tax=Rhizobium aegyptiacum TaxID=1764550 RepID=UPI0007E5A09E|nr:NADH:ubiquinone reductase (Na(+)-transporting) subunit F [Rhizobium aegyptiacum]
MFDAVLGVGLFTTIVMLSVAAVLAVRTALVASGTAVVTVNDLRKFSVPTDLKLLWGLAGADIHLPAACGGRGTCGQCRVTVCAGGGKALAIEAARIARRDLARGVRLACQVPVREDLRIKVPEEFLFARRIVCTVSAARNVSTLIREIRLDLLPGEPFMFRAGGYIQIECPPYRASFREFAIEPEYRTEWDRFDLWRYVAGTNHATTRAYSLANHPGESGIMLNVRIALPPLGAAPTVPPGIVSSYLFGLKPGDQVVISGPFGAMHAGDGGREMVLVGGGAGMAPLRSLIHDQLVNLGTKRPISFWYGARSRQELFYADEYEALCAAHPNFRWAVALSEPQPRDKWTGLIGFIHEVLYEQLLKDHPEPEECEYYLCGPPLMIKAVTRTLDDLGVPPENILFDDFGGSK